MIKIRIGQNNQGETISLSKSTRCNTGLAIHTATEPVIENTTKIIII